MPSEAHEPAQGRLILVVEDSEPIRGLLRMILGEAGYRVIEAGSVDEAAAAVAQGPELLITDIHLPGMNGVALARELRQLRPELKVIFMSGHDFGVVMPAGSEFLAKPFPPAVLIQKVRSMLG